MKRMNYAGNRKGNWMKCKSKFRFLLGGGIICCGVFVALFAQGLPARAEEWIAKALYTGTELAASDQWSPDIEAAVKVHPVAVSYSYLDENGTLQQGQITNYYQEGTTYAGLAGSFGLKAAEGLYPNFAGWELSSGYGADMVIGSSTGAVALKAVYASYDVTVTKYYLDAAGSLAKDTAVINYHHGTNFQDIARSLSAPSVTSGAVFDQWVCAPGNGEIGAVTISSTEITLYAAYKDKKLYVGKYEHYDENGNWVAERSAMPVNKAQANVQEAMQKTNSLSGQYGHYTGLRLSSWVQSEVVETDYYIEVPYQAAYENCMITLVYPDKTRAYQVLEKGATVTLPESHGTYTALVWSGMNGAGTVTVTNHAVYTCEAWKVSGGYTGMAQDENGKWIYMQDGVKDITKTGLVLYGDQWFYVYKGELDVEENGFVEYGGESFYVAGGMVQSSVSGIVRDGGEWYFVADGRFIRQFSGLTEYDGHWFLLDNGKLNTSYNGMHDYNDSTFLVAAGQIKYEYSGLYLAPDKKWYFIAEGQVCDNHSGLVLYDNQWFYVREGVLDTGYTGWVSYDGGDFWVVNGMLQS